MLLFCLGASCSRGSVLHSNLVRAFKDTVDLFTPLRGICMGPNTATMPKLTITGLELWWLRPEFWAQQYYVILSLWICETGDDCFISDKFNTNFNAWRCPCLEFLNKIQNRYTISRKIFKESQVTGFPLIQSVWVFSHYLVDDYEIKTTTKWSKNVVKAG